MIFFSRDFVNESFLNFVFRGLRSIAVRIRAKILFLLGFFAKGSCHKGVSIGSGFRVMNSKSITLGRNSAFGIFARVECHGRNAAIKIGDNSSFGDYLHIGAVQNISIGKNVLGGSNILIVDHNHGNTKSDLLQERLIPPRDRALVSKGGVIIEDNVWIADNVKILSGVFIGEGAIISIGAIVNENVPARTVFRGKK